MLRIGSTIRSPNTNARTPPKLMPPFHRTPASGTFPTEQTKLAIATTGPITGPQNFAAVGWPTRKSDCQKECGTHAARAPAIRSATAAYEHEDDAAPRAVAAVSVFGESSGSRRRISLFETTAWTTAESARPR